MIEILIDRLVEEVNSMKYLRGNEHYQQLKNLILCNLGKNILCFLIKYSVFRYFQLSFKINSHYQTLLSNT